MKFINKKFLKLVIIAGVLTFNSICSITEARENEENPGFKVIGFTIQGNTLLTENIMMDVLTPFTGDSISKTDIEKARKALESYYHKAGYIAVTVEVPGQTAEDLEDSLVDIVVIERKIREVRVKGNRYFTRDSILKRFPSLLPGNDIYYQSILQEFGMANRNPDMKISPVMIPMEHGKIDIELNVKDKLPLHGSFEINNRSSHNTTDLRANASIRFDNMWQKEHSFSIQYQTAPENRDEVALVAESYVFSPPWNPNHMIALYGVWSDSDTAFGEGFEVIGKGSIYGARYIIPLPALTNMYHNFTFGVDYKDFYEDVDFEDETEEGFVTPIDYLPFMASYSATTSDKMGKTQFSLGLNWAFRNFITDQREFEIKRFRARGDFLYITAGVERSHKLPLGMGLFGKLDGQITSEPLISNEQYTAGGMESVRGYKESEVSGDYAVHSNVEVIFPELVTALGFKKSRVNATFYYFYDMAKLWKKKPLPGEEKKHFIQSVGWGVKGTLFKHFEYRFDWAYALEDTDNVQSGDDSYFFKFKYVF